MSMTISAHRKWQRNNTEPSRCQCNTNAL